MAHPNPPLSEREREVVSLLLDGKSNQAIAMSLGIAERTVEFHLKNIYMKFQVRSRIELVLKLWNPTGSVIAEKLGYSTVDRQGENTENGDRLNSQMDWAPSLRDTVSIFGEELDMKALLNTRYVLVGLVSSLFAGFIWLAFLLSSGNLSLDEIRAWVAPLIVMVTMIGVHIGIIGKRSNGTLRRVFFSALLGTGLSPLTVIPLMIVVVLPLGKLAARFGLIDPSTMSAYFAEFLTTSAILAIWFVVGITIGTLLLFVTIKTPDRITRATNATKHCP